MTIRILGFAGSTRAASFHKKLVRIALKAAEEAGAETSFIDLHELQMPLYCGDLESSDGMPAGVRIFREELKAADGLLIASPEYNGAPSAVLKNAIDWATRPDPEIGEEPSLVAWQGKVAGIMSCSPGNLGGLRGLSQLRIILSGIGTHVLPGQVAVPSIHQHMTEDGLLEHADLCAKVEKLGTEVERVSRQLKTS